MHGYTDVGRMYGECILYWMLEYAMDGRDVDDYEMQAGSGLNDIAFKIGMDWLVEQRLLDRRDPVQVQ
jgi:hypothetical protein